MPQHKHDAAAPCGGAGAPRTGDAAAIDVAQVARLACLRLDGAELAAMQRDMADILHFAGALMAVDTSGAEAFSPTSSAGGALRADEAVPTDFAHALLEGAPCTEDGYLRAAKTFE